MKEEKFKVINFIRELIIYIDKNLENFPRKEIEIKNRIRNISYELLELAYMANITQYDKNKYIEEIIAKIKVLDFLLNLFYTGSIGTFSPVSYMDRSKITLIRPLIFTPEKDIKRYIRKNNIEVMKKVCPMDGISKREDMKDLIIKLSKDIPMLRANLFGAIRRNINDWKK